MQIEEVGIIGAGDMGKLYAKGLAKTGLRVNCCDLPQNREKLEQDLAGTGVNIFDDGIAVSRRSDLIFYLVPVEDLGKTIAQCGPSTRKNAIVSSGASVMTPAIEAFEKYLPRDTDIINWHLLAGSTVPLEDMASALVKYRSISDSYQRMMDAVGQLGPRIIELDSYQTHDKITADTQAVTHVGFEALGTAWITRGIFPWEDSTYVGGIDNVKILMCLRIYGGKPHVYSGLAIYNPYAGEQIQQYADSEADLFGLMIQGRKGAREFRQRINKAKAAIFNDDNSPILLDDKVMGKFSLGIPSEQGTPNSHLSLLSMVDAWYQAGINPYDNMICQTPVFRLRLGIVEYLFRHPQLLEESIRAALYNTKIRRDDLEFHTAVSKWNTIIQLKDAVGYCRQFEDFSVRSKFAGRIPEGMRRSGELIKQLSKAV